MKLRDRWSTWGRKRKLLVIALVGLLGSCGLCGIITQLMPESDTPERVATVALATAVPEATRTAGSSRTPVPSRTATTAPTKADTATPTSSPTPAPTSTSTPTPEGGGTVYITASGSKYHKLGCSTIDEKNATPVTCEWARANGYEQCHVCYPHCP